MKRGQRIIVDFLGDREPATFLESGENGTVHVHFDGDPDDMTCWCPEEAVEMAEPAPGKTANNPQYTFEDWRRDYLGS